MLENHDKYPKSHCEICSRDLRLQIGEEPRFCGMCGRVYCTYCFVPNFNVCLECYHDMQDEPNPHAMLKYQQSMAKWDEDQKMFKKLSGIGRLLTSVFFMIVAMVLASTAFKKYNIEIIESGGTILEHYDIILMVLGVIIALVFLVMDIMDLD